MKEYVVAIVTMITGDIMHAEYLHGDVESILNRIHAWEHNHTILSVSFPEILDLAAKKDEVSRYR